ncbi:MAG: hypothetical protein Q7V63_04930 [Gammaproteobacteria bacterium]|nr:hypothetical protein [Gammaproteobacteria bacterium]
MNTSKADASFSLRNIVIALATGFGLAAAKESSVLARSGELLTSDAPFIDGVPNKFQIKPGNYWTGSDCFVGGDFDTLTVAAKQRGYVVNFPEESTGTYAKSSQVSTPFFKTFGKEGVQALCTSTIDLSTVESPSGPIQFTLQACKGKSATGSTCSDFVYSNGTVTP